MSPQPLLKLRFEIVDELDGTHRIVPCVDGRRFDEVVAHYEQQHDLQPAGGYSGIVANLYPPSEYPDYYLGLRHSYPEARRWPWPLRPKLRAQPATKAYASRVQILACDCGEAGCWPGVVTVTSSSDDVTWAEFGNPHRPERDYSTLGPFRFDRDQYDIAVDRLAGRLRQLGAQDLGEGPSQP